jgi:hypothetical protein
MGLGVMTKAKAVQLLAMTILRLLPNRAPPLSRCLA